MRFRCCFSILSAFALIADAQQPAPQGSPIAAARTEIPMPGPPPPKAVTGAVTPTTVTPTWETQKGARTYVLGIPAPRGQIVDRNGQPLAQTRVGYNLALAFPTPLKFTDSELRRFAEQQIMLARSLTGRPISVTEEQLQKHYKNRGAIPMLLKEAQDLSMMEIEKVRQQKSEALILQPVYQRFYPQGELAGHILGYTGRAGRALEGPVENNELLWPEAEGRDGLEQSFDDQLKGKVGQMNISFDAAGKKSSEQIVLPPQPGFNVVTTLDANLQRLCEETLAKGCKRGALVLIDATNGEILAMASYPMVNPNWWIPFMGQTQFDVLRNDPNNPLVPRAFRSSYPPGSTFKVFVGLAAMQSGKVLPGDEFSCPPSIEIGNLTFRNWKREHAGDLNFVDALTQSCNPYFYQVGQRIGAQPIVDYSLRLGMGVRTGIPLASETNGRIPTQEYMLKTHKRAFMPGDVANLSIGQGDTLVSPLQMAQAMAAIGNGGMLYQTRLVQQVQGLDNQIVNAYSARVRTMIDIDKKVRDTLREAMVQVVASRAGTAGRASVPGIQVAGKTGTAQWGPKNNERTAAWFAGFAPADKPKYAFAALYEGEADNDDVHGGTQAAPLIGKVLREIYKTEK
ncbi:MAG TPA: penicillin-binding protein 2, partial [Chthoniobacteraceae bacterium]|nr:penicillin-binding protein 2 [Chthoniobacteraceae bacterium]